MVGTIYLTNWIDVLVDGIRNIFNSSGTYTGNHVFAFKNILEVTVESKPATSKVMVRIDLDVEENSDSINHLIETITKIEVDGMDSVSETEI